MSSSKGNGPAALSALLLVVGVICLGIGIFYFTVDTNFLADDFGRHITHGIVFTGLGILFLIGVFFSRRRRSSFQAG
ncbi:MAG TPA: hypothetical protein VGR53_10490 [Nitrososphaerales archaeon]|nr:hypothetical protein [Nitrososphaerales archaeon]